MSNQHSSYNFWTWLVAILLALILLWMLLTGHGPSSACCAAPAAVAPVEEVMPPVPAAAAEACHFAASSTEYTANEACASVAWTANSDALKLSLVGDMRAKGDDKAVVLTGTVDSEEIKAQKGQEAQMFFGAVTTFGLLVTLRRARNS